MENVWNAAKEEIRRRIFPFTLIHLLYFIIITAFTFYITRFFLKYTLIRWMYVSSMIIIIANVYHGKKPIT